jgi:HTH-type transcriptional regulator/antitoxin HigA
MDTDFESPQTPGTAIRKLLQERNWTQADLAKILDRPIQTVNQIIQNTKSITPEMAVSLGAAFGTTAEKWMLLESNYRLSLTKTNPDPVQRRAKLYAYAPIKEMQKRQWIKASESLEEQEKSICKFFEVESTDVTPQIAVATRESLRFSELTAAQKTWCFRAKQIAKAIRVKQFDPAKNNILLSRLRSLATYPENARHVSELLAEFGIRFFIIEPLQSTRIDGAALWIDATSPVIIVSLRYDRLDAFWFTLMHELSHILHGDNSFDDELLGEGEQLPSIAKDDIERRADNDAANYLIPAETLNSFILRVSPLYSKDRINQFANRVKIHPGIIVGQLQHRGEIGYSANREMLPKIREIVINSAVTDGWGRLITIDLN